MSLADIRGDFDRLLACPLSVLSVSEASGMATRRPEAGLGRRCFGRIVRLDRTGEKTSLTQFSDQGYYGACVGRAGVDQHVAPNGLRQRGPCPGSPKAPNLRFRRGAFLPSAASFFPDFFGGACASSERRKTGPDHSCDLIDCHRGTSLVCPSIGFAESGDLSHKLGVKPLEFSSSVTADRS